MKGASEGLNEVIRRAAQSIKHCDRLLITAGAGLGVDSGLPDFRGPEGFWRAYPAYKHLGLEFQELANPRWFEEDPALAWGFYGHRMELYRATRPHDGFAIMLRWAQARSDHFVFTSNVDDAFARSGFDRERIYEVHGTLSKLQCTRNCGVGIFPSDAATVTIDPATFRAVGELPKCCRCGSLARPNVLMFNDVGYDFTNNCREESKFEHFVNRAGRLTILELGCGTHVPSVRIAGETVASSTPGCKFIRINPRESEIDRGAGDFERISIPLGALDALTRIDALMLDA